MSLVDADAVDDKLGEVSNTDSNLSTTSINGSSLPKVETTLIVLLSGDAGSRIELFEVFLQAGSLRSKVVLHHLLWVVGIVKVFLQFIYAVR